MKKRFFMVVIVVLTLMGCIFSGCEKQPGERSEALSVYVVETDALYVNAINSFQKQTEGVELNVTTFESYKAMFDVMNVELMSKGGPDVVLYNSMQGEVDGQKLAKSGLLLPLEPFMEQLDPAVYPTALMNAGNIAGKQYFIPFSYNLIYAYTSEALMVERGYSPSDSIYEMILDESEALIGVADKAPTTVNIYRLDPVNAFFDAAGVQLFDKNSESIVADKTELEEICRFVKLIYDNAEKTGTLTNRFSNDFAGAVRSFSFFTEDYAFMNNVRFYQSMFPDAADSPMSAIPYHKMNAPQELCASIVCFGGINANTKMPEKAYELLKYILDYNVSNDWSKYEEASVYYAPVSFAAFQMAVDELSANRGYGPVTIMPLSEQNAEQLKENAQRITHAVIPNMTLGISVQEVLEPYFMGEDSFEHCYDALLNKLQLYLSE